MEAKIVAKLLDGGAQQQLNSKLQYPTGTCQLEDAPGPGSRSKAALSEKSPELQGSGGAAFVTRDCPAIAVDQPLTRGSLDLNSVIS